MSNSFKRGITAVFIANVINMLFSVIISFLLPKYLSVESYAGIKEFQLYVSYAGLFHLGYVDGIYLKYGGKELEHDISGNFYTEMSTMRIFQVIITACTVIVALLINNRLLLLFGLSILPQNMANYFKYLYQAIGKFNLYGKIMNLTTIVTFILNMTLVFVVRTDNLYAYVVGYVVLYFLIWLILEVYFRRHHSIKKAEYFQLPVLFEKINCDLYKCL